MSAKRAVQAKVERKISFSDFELVFSNYAQPPDVAALRQSFVGVKEIIHDAASKTVRVMFQQKGQAEAAYEAALFSETRVGIYDRVIGPFMPDAEFVSKTPGFSKALNDAVAAQEQQAARRRPRRK